MDKTASEAEREEFNKLHGEISRFLVEAPPEGNFEWREIIYDLPQGPKLNATVQCAFCGEGT